MVIFEDRDTHTYCRAFSSLFLRLVFVCCGWDSSSQHSACRANSLWPTAPLGFNSKRINEWLSDLSCNNVALRYFTFWYLLSSRNIKKWETALLSQLEWHRSYIHSPVLFSQESGSHLLACYLHTRTEHSEYGNHQLLCPARNTKCSVITSMCFHCSQHEMFTIFILFFALIKRIYGMWEGVSKLKFICIKFENVDCFWKNFDPWKSIHPSFYNSRSVGHNAYMSHSS